MFEGSATTVALSVAAGAATEVLLWAKAFADIVAATSNANILF